MPEGPHQDAPVLVIDYGAQYAQLIARRVRECHVYSEIVPHDLSVEEIAAASVPPPSFSPGDRSRSISPVPRGIDPGVFDLGVPVLGICYGQQLMASALGGEVGRTGVAEFGKTELDGRRTRLRPVQGAARRSRSCG